MFNPGTFVTQGELAPAAIDDVFVVVKRHPEHPLSKVIACRFESDDVELDVADISACDIGDFTGEYEARASDIHRCPACGREANDKTTTSIVVADGFANVSKQCNHCSHEYVLNFDYSGAGAREKLESKTMNSIKQSLIEAYGTGALRPMQNEPIGDDVVTVESVVESVVETHHQDPVEAQRIVNALVKQWPWLGVHIDGAPFGLSIQDYNDMKYLLRHEGLIDIELFNPDRAGEFDFELTEDCEEPVAYVGGFDLNRTEVLRLMNGYYALEHAKAISSVRSDSGHTLSPRAVALDEWVLGSV